MDQCVYTQQNDKSRHACVRKNLTNARNGELWLNFDLFNNAGLDPPLSDVFSQCLLRPQNYRNRSDTAVVFYSVTEPNYLDYTDIVPQPAQKTGRHNFLSEGKLL